MSPHDWLTLAAILLGPLLGAGFALGLEGRRERRTRRLEIFKTLMRTRRTPMWPDHVGALNLVELEFFDNREVLSAWKALLEHLGKPQARRPEEEVREGILENAISERDRAYYQRLGQERQTLLSKLLHAMGKDLGFKIEQLEIFEGGYTPQGWGTFEDEQTVVRKMFADIALGRRMFPIGVFHFPSMDQESEDTESTDK